MEKLRSADQISLRDEELRQVTDKFMAENAHLLKQRNDEMDRCLKIEETIDLKNERILQLEKELQRKCDEVNLRKEVIDSMS